MKSDPVPGGKSRQKGQNMKHITEYPVMPEEYTIEKAPFVYTKKAEELGRKYNTEPRTVGTIACFAGEVLRECRTADDWMRRGYIERRKSLDAGVEK